jgi:histidinol dehydrogenase
VAAIPQHWTRMGAERVGYSAAVLGGPRGGVLVTPDIQSAYDFVNDYAPEHLGILGAEPMQHMGHIRNAGEILLGPHTPFTLGNFVIGPNAVLPTSGAARTVSPLSVLDYVKRSSIAYVTAAGYPLLAPQAEALARYEGFDGHANAVSDWRQQGKDKKIC